VIFSQLQYFPITTPFLALFGAMLGLLVLILQIRIFRYAFTSLGITPAGTTFILLACLAGSLINIPIGVMGPNSGIIEQEIVHHGMHYVVPKLDSKDVILAVNVGGAIIPLLLSIFLMNRHHLWLKALISSTLVATICYNLTEPVHGIGLALPSFVPPLAAVIVALVVSWRDAGILAYICGTIGTLIGGDLLNLDKIVGLGAPVASISGAGTFDGIFLTGIIAVLLAGMLEHKRTTRMPMHP
jgi:uncharacterized membrane protein